MEKLTRQNQLKRKFQTTRTNSKFSSIPLLSTELNKIKSGEPININQFSARVTSARESSNFLADINSLKYM